MNDRAPPQRRCLVEPARVSHHELATVVTRDVACHSLRCLTRRQRPGARQNHPPRLRTYGLILADRSTGSVKYGFIFKAVATLCVAVVGLLSFVVLVQTVWAQ